VRYDVTHRRRTWTVTDDRTVVVAAAVTGRLVDETTGEAITAPATLHVAHPTMLGRVLDGGWFAISALPAVDLPLLDTDAYTVEASLRAPGFTDLDLAFTLPAGGALPLEAGDLPVPRRPVSIRGRVTHSVTGAPVSGALVFASQPVASQQVLATRWPLRFDHAAGVDVRRRRLDDTATVTELTAAVRGGERVLALASRSGIAVDDVLRVGAGDRAEFAVVSALDPEPADPTLPGRVTLTAPLHRGFEATAPVRLLNPAVVPQTRTLTAPARAGDGLLLLDGALAPDTVDTVEVLDPGRMEYGVIGAPTDPAGFYRFDGVGRLAGLRLVARAAGLSDAARTIAIDYGATTNYVNFRLDP
jgi:hypothetical protein